MCDRGVITPVLTWAMMQGHGVGQHQNIRTQVLLLQFAVFYIMFNNYVSV